MWLANSINSYHPAHRVDLRIGKFEDFPLDTLRLVQQAHGCDSLSRCCDRSASELFLFVSAHGRTLIKQSNPHGGGSDPPSCQRVVLLAFPPCSQQ